MEILIVGFIVFLAIVYIVRTFYKSVSDTGSGCGCSNSCGGCAKDNSFDGKDCSEIIK